MNKLFLILLPVGTDREEVIKYLSDNNFITNFFYNMPFAFYVRVNNIDANTLRNIITGKFTNIELIMVINLTRNVDFSALVPDEHRSLYYNI